MKYSIHSNSQLINPQPRAPNYAKDSFKYIPALYAHFPKVPTELITTPTDMCESGNGDDSYKNDPKMLLNGHSDQHRQR